MLSFIVFRLFSFFISRLPWCCVYMLSDFLTFLMYYLFRYRRKIALTNLSNSFPEKEKAELLVILKASYRNISDILFECIKTEHLTKEELEQKMEVKNIEIVNKFYNEGKSIVALVTHKGNWEWIGPRSQFEMLHPGFVAYKHLSNKYFDKYVMSLREHFFKGRMIYFKAFLKFILSHKKDVQCYFFPADQTPTKSEIGCWITFLNQETGFFVGAERIAKSLGMGVVYFDVHRVKRSKYVIDIQLLSEDASKEPDFEITKRYAKKLEKSLIEHPTDWLWTHKRWKHKRE